MTFSSSLSVFQQLADEYNKNKTEKRFLGNATLLDLTEALGAVFVGFETTSETVPPQAKYNATVVSALEKKGFFKFTAGLLNQLCDFYDSGFAFCTVNVPLGKFPRPSREEFQQFKHLYVLDQNMSLPLADVFPIELIRAVRLHLMQLLFRFFKTYDVDETYSTKEGTFQVCDPTKATFRSNGHTVATADFYSFAEYLVKANRYLKGLTLDLSEFVQPFRTAAQVAKAERAAYNKTQAKAHYQAKTQAKPQTPAQSPTPRQASLQKTFSVEAKPFVPASPPTVNPWKDRKAKHEATVAAAAAAAAASPVSEPHSEPSSDVEPEVPVTENDGEFKVVAKKKRTNSPPQKRQRFRANRA
jgi:hypothetical protein